MIGTTGNDIYVNSTNQISKKSHNSLGAIIGATIGSIITVLIIIGIIIIIMCCRIQSQRPLHQMELKEPREDIVLKPIETKEELYIHLPNDRNLIDFSEIELKEKLGEGNFGIVWK